MTIRANKFTPEVLLSAPRRSAATPNSDGSLALFSTSTYSFETHSKSVEIRVLNIATGKSTLLTNDVNASEAVWLGGNMVVWLVGGKKGVMKLVQGDASAPKKSPSTVAEFPGPVGNLKVCQLKYDTFAIALTGQATSSGGLFNPETAERPLSSGQVYTSLFVRHWDKYVEENKSTIWFGLLVPQGRNYTLSGLSNVLKTQKGYNPLKLETPPPFSGSDNFDISKSGIVFIAKDPKRDPANYTKTDLYYVPLTTFTEAEAEVPQIVTTGKLRGYCGTPVFSPDARSLAFTRMKSDMYESDKPRLLLIPDITDLSNVQEFFEGNDGDGLWDRSPSISCWSQDGKELYLTAEEYGKAKLWKTPSAPNQAKTLPTCLIDEGAVSDVKPLAKGSNRLFVTSTSLIDNSIYSILNPSESSAAFHRISSNSKDGKAFGLSQDQVDDFWFQGAGAYHVHALVMKPSNFDKNKKYPLAYLIHGGPQGAWLESWSTRWNPAIFAEAGYVVVTPNPTGSTGYGMAFQNGIKNEWGGRPYEDLVKCFSYIETYLPYIDTSRAVGLGASYGGYMMNWIQGQPLGRKFKALVTHDGVFSTLNQYASDELFFPRHDFGGTLWENRPVYEKWDPARYVANWATPHLIIHNERDYRLPISEGLAPFNVLQSLKIPSRFLTFPDENHWVLKPENSLLWHKEVLGWINKYSGIEKEEEEEQLARRVAELEV